MKDVLSALRDVMEIAQVDIGKLLDHPCVLETRQGCCDDTVVLCLMPDPSACSLLMAAELKGQPLVTCIVPSGNEVWSDAELCVRADIEKAVHNYMIKKGEEFNITFVPLKP